MKMITYFPLLTMIVSQLALASIQPRSGNLLEATLVKPVDTTLVKPLEATLVKPVDATLVKPLEATVVKPKRFLATFLYPFLWL